MNLLRLLAATLALALAGCAAPRDSVVFVTKTSLGIDVDSTPPTASIAYDRVEGYYGPRFDGGGIAPVAGSFFTDGALLNRQIKQLYATGDAAVIVSQGTPTPTSQVSAYSGGTRPMFFGTSTVIGVKLGFGAGGAPESMTFGFKRKEASVIPITTVSSSTDPNGTPTLRFPSVLASLETGFASTSQGSTTFGVQQYFATGLAAEQVARYPRVQEVFERNATDALAQYRQHERVQAQVLLDVLTCLAQLPDGPKLKKVWDNVVELKLVSDKEAAARLVGEPLPGKARELYTRHITTLDAASAVHTGLLTGHRSYVCDLRE